MDEQRKDKIEDAASAVVEGLISLVPGIGGPLAVLANRTLGSPFERRTVRILNELRADIARLEEEGKAAEDRAGDEDVQAAVHRTVRQLLEATSDEKRTLLRNALLHRIMGEDGDPFDEALDRVQPTDIAYLQEAGRFGIQVAGASPVIVRGGRGTRDEMKRARLLLLERLGLVAATASPNQPPESKLSFARSPSRRLILTAFGTAFLDYVRSPMDTPARPDEGA